MFWYILHRTVAQVIIAEKHGTNLFNKRKQNQENNSDKNDMAENVAAVVDIKLLGKYRLAFLFGLCRNVSFFYSFHS